jgi:hypothetical protein
MWQRIFSLVLLIKIFFYALNEEVKVCKLVNLLLTATIQNLTLIFTVTAIRPIFVSN